MRAAGRRRIKRGRAGEGAWPAPPPGRSAPRGPLPAAELTAPAHTAHSSPWPGGSVASTSGLFSGSSSESQSAVPEVGGSESRAAGSGGEVSARRARNRGLLGADRCSRARQQSTGKAPRPDSGVSAARVESRTGVCDGAQERTPARPRPPLPGVGVGLFTRSFRGAVKGTRLGGSLGGRGGASSGPRRSRHCPDPHSAQVGRRVPGAAVSAGQPPRPAFIPGPPNLLLISRGACYRGLEIKTR